MCPNNEKSVKIEDLLESACKKFEINIEIKMN